ncbi:hypothetical protein Lnau_2999 [Legionella nautarum]|uniref:Uncharacterized protein n=1 Tax=Legionella nautarum TaxID=45070 RepID=A0A0W0WM09_9GAMM|nr:hypothetical protein [Legionella nautarum]KTD33351.1 hypothetical protein Lnau_2999 [Legionella nautarum]
MMYKIIDIFSAFNDIKDDSYEKIQDSVKELIDRYSHAVRFRELEYFDSWVESHRKANYYNVLYAHLLGYEYQDNPFSIKKLIYIRPISGEKFELPVIDDEISETELSDLINKFLSSIPSLVEADKAPQIIEDLSSIIDASSDERTKKRAHHRIQDFALPYKDRYATHQLLIAQLNVKIKKAIDNPRWDTMGVGFFGCKTPTTIAQLRALFSEVEKSENELMDGAERILEDSLKRTPMFRSTEAAFVYRNLLNSISDFRKNYSFAQKSAENNAASENRFFSFFTSFYETNIRPYFESDKNHRPETTL